jgi:hypothetical protein
MEFRLDFEKIQWPPLGSFEANILCSITVPFQEIVISGGQHPLPSPPIRRPPHGSPIVISWEGLRENFSFENTDVRLPSRPRKLGTLKGTVRHIAPDFDAPLGDFKDHME